MRISVQPAKRDDQVKIIFDRPVTADQVQPGKHGVVSLLLLLPGLYGDGSHYRYTLTLAAEEVQLLLTPGP
jgi:hypothetical protein